VCGWGFRNGPDSRGKIGVGLDRKVGWGLVLEVERKVGVSCFQRQQVTRWLIYCQKWCETICLLITFYFLCCRDDQGHEEAESGNTRRSPSNYPVGDVAISKDSLEEVEGIIGERTGFEKSYETTDQLESLNEMKISKMTDNSSDDVEIWREIRRNRQKVTLQTTKVLNLLLM
jgi:hypothetical protein